MCAQPLTLAWLRRLRSMVWPLRAGTPNALLYERVLHEAHAAGVVGVRELLLELWRSTGQAHREWSVEAPGASSRDARHGGVAT